MNIDRFFIDTAQQLIDIAANIAQSYFRKDYEIDLKKDISAVTQADRLIEQEIRRYLSQALPEHGIFGEEFAEKQTLSDYYWVIDPIDGTTSFICGKPTFTTLIALIHHEQPLLGVITQPIINETWWGIAGQQSMFNGRLCQHAFSKHTVTEASALRLNITTPLMFTPAQYQQVQKVIKTATVTSFGGDGYAYGLLACGAIDVIVEADLKFYDVAAIIPIIEGAGGMISDWQGKQINRQTFDGTLLATRDPIIHKQILNLLHTG